VAAVGGQGIGRFHLAEDLRFPYDERVETRRNAKDVSGDRGAAMHVEVRGNLCVRHVVVVAQEARQRFGLAVPVDRRVDFRAVAGGEHDPFPGYARGHQGVQRALDAVAREIDALAQLDGRAPVTETGDEEAHG
jgi:hypothetical protein